MKTRFTTMDVCAVVTEINSRLVGMRLANVYDINNKTYLLKLAKPDCKAMLLMESGIRLHVSEFDWPKNMMPSGFSMKLRKHLRGRRLVSAKQLGIDRIIDMQFGSEEAAFHIILELYDRGNIILTDYKYKILNILRFRKDVASTKGDGSTEDNSDVRFAVSETYPLQTAKQRQDFADVKDKLKEVLKDAKDDVILKRILNPQLPYGAPCIEHCLLLAGYPPGAKMGKDFNMEKEVEKLFDGLLEGDKLLDKMMEETSGGYIIQKSEKKADGTSVLTNIEFHPILFKQHETCPHLLFDSFNKTVDEFFGSMESQKADMKILQQEKTAHKKLDNIRKDHEHRLAHLEKEQATDTHKAQLIEENLPLVEQAIRVVRTAIANQIDWEEINSLIKDAKANEDAVALSISKLNLQSNEFTMALSEVRQESESDDDSSEEDDTKGTVTKSKKPKPVKVDIDLGLSAYANAKKYYNKKRQASTKQQKIIDASQKALKSAEKKTTQSLKEATTIHNIQKARKTFWFEKFIWFISSENYLIIGGRDAQQNEILVKKYLTGGDVYVHADLHGATSCIIKNPTSTEIPPKTLNEAGTMAICHSAAWTAKVVTSAWWVHSHQVSKTAPSGEYLTTGSFLIRGKKNYLPPSYLVYGFGLLFKVDETCVHSHKDERKVMILDAKQEEVGREVTEESLSSELEKELDMGTDSDGSDSDQDSKDAESGMIEEDSTKSPLTGPTSLEDVEDGDPQDPVYSKGVGDSNQVHEVTDSDQCPRSSELAINSDMKSEDVELDEDSQDSASSKTVDDNQEPQVASVSVIRSSENINITPDVDKPVEFPDTNIRVKYKPLSFLSGDMEDEEPHVVYLGDDEPVLVKNRKGKNRKNQSEKPGGNNKKSVKFDEGKNDEFGNSSSRSNNLGVQEDAENVNRAPQPKRGQKNKMKKMKNKYKDQDEEERAIKMELLQQSQSQKARDRKAKKNKAAAQQEKKRAGGKGVQKSSKPPPHPTPKPQEEDPDSDEERAKVLQNEHLLEESVGILNSLTGCPLSDDILLFALPVCAPYNTMHNYKFKVKLTPGNTKKGKGAKTALNLFQNMRETTAQEKDHLRSIKDHDLAQNMPGKVKVSSTNLQLQRKKK